MCMSNSGAYVFLGILIVVFNTLERIRFNDANFSSES